jgi:2-polyprenyl-3-methyl-5-hydroxy-6-metoxy-1,4-benzoquinol methylase
VEGTVNSRYDAQIDVNEPNNTHAMLVKMAGEGVRILELGASSGYMTRVLKERGNHVTAVEVDEVAAAQLKEIADVTIVADLNDPEALAAVPGPFDVVLAGDVLEHLLDPEAVLKRAVATLDPDGAVVISVPNVTHIDLRLALFQGRFEYQPTGLLDETHVRFYTYESLLELLAASGLIVAEIERSTVAAFESEIEVDRDLVTDEVLAEALRVPEAETYQFIVRAVIDHGDKAARRRSKRLLETARNRVAAAQGTRAAGPIGESISAQLQTARGYLATAEAERDSLREEVTRLQAALAEAGTQAGAVHQRLEEALRALGDAEQRLIDRDVELDGVRRELTAACIAEARGRAELAELRAHADHLQHVAEAALADQALLAELVSSRAFRTVSRYRRTVNFLFPVNSRRRAAVRPLARLVRP